MLCLSRAGIVRLETLGLKARATRILKVIGWNVDVTEGLLDWTLTTFCSSGRIFGFLLGSVLAGSGLYYYVVDEYKVSNELLTEDVYVSLL